MTTNNAYTDARMNLNQVCNWLTQRDQETVAWYIHKSFSNHPFTVEGMMRKDVIKQIFEKVFDSAITFRELECNVATILSIVPAYEAHVD